MTSQINNLNLSTNPTSLQNLYKFASDLAVTLDPNVKSVEAVLTQSLSQTREFGAAWRDLEDCRALRKTLV